MPPIDLRTRSIFYHFRVGLEPGAWSLGPGAWIPEPGAWSLDPGAWSLEPGAWSLETGAALVSTHGPTGRYARRGSTPPATRTLNYSITQHAARSSSRQGSTSGIDLITNLPV